MDVLEMSWKRRSKGVGDVAHASSGGGGGAGGVGEREVFLKGLEEEERSCKFLKFFHFIYTQVVGKRWGGG